MSNDALIERLEQATADEQYDLLIAAFEACFPQHYMPGRSGIGPSRWERFKRMLDAGAYESAALTLVPEGCVGWSLDWNGKRAAFGLGFGGIPESVAAEAATPALAICIASLKARP